MRAVIVREAVPADAPAIARLHVEGWEEFRAFVAPALYQVRTIGYRTEYWRERIEAADPRRWIALVEVGGEPLGFVGVEQLATPEFGAKSEIRYLFVAAGWRQRGVGRRLLSAAAEWIGARGAEPVMVCSFTQNRHRVAYGRLGGRIVGERRSAWDGVAIPETCYVWPSAAELSAATRPKPS